MVIDPKAEPAARKMLGHAIRHELEELAALAQAEGSETVPGIISLCLLASAYIATDVSGRWPAEADLREIAKNASEAVTGLDITEQEIHAYLSRIALGPDKLDDVFSDQGLATIPLFATANLLLTPPPPRQAVVRVPRPDLGRRRDRRAHQLTVLPALLLRARKKPARARTAAAEPPMAGTPGIAATR